MANKLELVVVDTQHANPYLYCFANSEAEAKTRLEEACESRRKDAARYSLLLEGKPNNQAYKLYLEEAQNARFEVMTYEEYRKREREYLLKRPIEEVSEACFDDAFNCLPPLHIRQLGGKDWYFSMCEFYTGTFTNQYAKINGKYYRALVDITNPSTYIYNRLEEEQ